MHEKHPRFIIIVGFVYLSWRIFLPELILTLPHITTFTSFSNAYYFNFSMFNLNLHRYFSSSGPLHMIVMAILKERTRICPERWLKNEKQFNTKDLFHKYFSSYQSYTLRSQLSVRSRHSGTLTDVGLAACNVNNNFRGERGFFSEIQ